MEGCSTVQLLPGEYYLQAIVLIQTNGVVLKGVSATQTDQGPHGFLQPKRAARIVPKCGGAEAEAPDGDSTTVSDWPRLSTPGPTTPDLAVQMETARFRSTAEMRQDRDRPFISSAMTWTTRLRN